MFTLIMVFLSAVLVVASALINLRITKKNDKITQELARFEKELDKRNGIR